MSWILTMKSFFKYDLYKVWDIVPFLWHSVLKAEWLGFISTQAFRALFW